MTSKDCGGDVGAVEQPAVALVVGMFSVSNFNVTRQIYECTHYTNHNGYRKLKKGRDHTWNCRRDKGIAILLKLFSLIRLPYTERM